MNPYTKPPIAATPATLMNKLHLGFLTFALIGALVPDRLDAAAGDLFVVDGSVNSIVKYNSAAGKTTFASGLSDTVAVVFDSKGNVFAVDGALASGAGSGTIYKFTPGGVKTVFASGFTLPQG